jgi:flagellar motility protein MotE (MotC chaperone)
MIARIFSPLVVGLIGLLLSIVVGVTAVWQTMDTHVSKTMAVRALQSSNELKKRGWDFWTIEMENLATELREDRDRQKKIDADLTQRESRVEASEHELAKERAELQAMQKQISDRIFEISDDERINLKKIAQNFANITPRAAVAIIREMDDSTAVKILSMLKADTVGPIFQEMSQAAGADGNPLARRAAQLSDKLRLVKNVKTTASP